MRHAVEAIHHLGIEFDRPPIMALTALVAYLTAVVALATASLTQRAVADLIIGDPVESERWIATWRARPKELMRQPSACLFDRDDLTDRLAEITCPALVVHGVDDHALPMEEAHHLANGLVGAGAVVEVPGAHAANLTHPGPVNDAVLRFLAELPA